ncbi:MAG TPA: DOMON-like domain-containing protein [Allosphingosinicella sp.]
MSVERRSRTLVRFNYLVLGRLDELVVPPPAPAARADKLWQTTCFEAFLRPRELTSYLELNFSPSGEWAAYGFSAYRAGMALASMPGPPTMSLTRGTDRLELDVLVSIDVPREPCALALTAVIEERIGKSYWAAHHAGGGPDFHHPACFADELPPAPAA